MCTLNQTTSPPRSLRIADALFNQGRFSEAETACLGYQKSHPKDDRVFVRLGYICLLSNRPSDAERYLRKACGIKHKNATAKELLAETYYRRDEFQKAASLLNDIGRKAMAAKLDSFAEVMPYEISGPTGDAIVRFSITDPLPIVQLELNGSEPSNFLIDTGGGELIVDTEFAKENGVVQFGEDASVFGGGKKGAFQHARVDSCKLGELTVKQVPALTMDLRRFSKPVFKRVRLDGIIGTVFLYHFIPTLDFVKARLVLRRRSPENVRRVESESLAQSSYAVPFWMADDHIMVAWGTVNGGKAMLMFVDTGLAGGGFSCPKSTIKEAGIDLKYGLGGIGMGGGGEFKFVPFFVDELTLGEFHEEGILGAYLGKFPLDCGFRIGGLVSHGFFRRSALTFDFIGMRLFIQRPEHSSP